MRVAIYQPQYFPRLHYFNRILDSDIFVLLESAQYSKSLVHHSDGKKERHKSYQSDCPIKLPDKIFHLTIPVKNGIFAINQTRIDYTHKWGIKHILTIKSAYGKSPFFGKYFELVKKMISGNYKTLSELNTQTILWSIFVLIGKDAKLDKLNIRSLNDLLSKNKKVRLKKIIRDTQIPVKRPEGISKGTEWTAKICKYLGATEYFHGGTAQKGYMEYDYYKELGIKPILQDWKCKTYEQQFSDRFDFVPNLSILDIIFNLGESESLKIILPKK